MLVVGLLVRLLLGHHELDAVVASEAHGALLEHGKWVLALRH